MTIASEITDLATNLSAAKTAVTTKGGTVGDTGLAGLASEIATIPSGGGEYIAPYGNLYYDEFYALFECSILECYDGEATMTLNQDVFLNLVAYSSNIDLNQNYYEIEYENGVGFTLRWETAGGNQSMGPYVDEIELEDYTGIQITWTIDDQTETKQSLYGTIQIEGTSLSRYDQQGNPVYGGVLYIQDADSFARLVPRNNPITEARQAFSYAKIVGNDIPTFCVRKFVFGPSTPSTIPDYFLSECSSLGGDIVMPSTVTTIGTHFLENTPVNSVTVPSSVTSVGTSFLRGCNSLTSLVVNTNNSPNDDYSVTCTNTTSPAYAHGVIVTGSGQTTWLTNLPNRNTSPYRKLLDEGV